MLLALILAAGPATLSDSSAKDLAVGPHASGGLDNGGVAAAQAALQFLVNGEGASSVVDLCDAMQAGDKAGNWYCYRGDGTTQSGSVVTLTTYGTAPDVRSRSLCGNGASCGAMSETVFNGTSSAVSTGTYYTSPTGSFSVCAAITPLGSAAPRLMGQEGTAVNTQTFVLQLSTVSPIFTVWKPGGAQTQLISGPVITARSPSLVCGTYQYVADGTSIMRVHANKQTPSTNSTAVGPPLNGAPFTVPHTIGRRSFLSDVNYAGAMRGAFFTEKALTQADVDRLHDAVVGTLTVSTGQALTVTRSTSRTCSNADGSEYTVVPAGRPCVREGGLDVEGGFTNYALQSESFDSATWGKLFTGSMVAPVVTANTTEKAAPDGSYTAEKVVFPASTGLEGGTHYSMLSQDITVANATYYRESVYLATDSGTKTIYLWNAGIGSTCTVSTTWTRCSVAGTSTSTNWAFRIGYDMRAATTPNQTGQPGGVFYVSSAQLEQSAAANALNAYHGPTTTAAVARNADNISAAFTPSASVGCATARFKTRLASTAGRVVGFTSSDAALYFQNTSNVGSFFGVAAVTQATTSFANGARTVLGLSKWTASGKQTCVDGTCSAVGTLGTMTAGSTIYLGSQAGSGQYLFGVLSDVKVDNTDSERCN
jgi:hypothetical protein